MESKFRFECPHCHAQTDVSTDYAGQKGACFACGREIVIPFPDQQIMRESERLQKKERSENLRGCFGAMGLAAAVIVLSLIAYFVAVKLLLPTLGLDSASVERAKQNQNLKLISKALLQYHEKYGRFPPAVVYDPKTNMPMHSWRALLIPFMDVDSGIKSYNFDEPWNGPTNSLLHTSAGHPFSNPRISTTAVGNDTDFVYVTGTGTIAANKQKSLSQDEILDGSKETICVVEVASSGIHWLEPRDLDINLMQFVSGSYGTEVSAFDGRPAVLTADGKVHQLKKDYSNQKLRTLLTPNGGEIPKIGEIADSVR